MLYYFLHMYLLDLLCQIKNIWQMKYFLYQYDESKQFVDGLDWFGLWCLTIFQLYCGCHFIDLGNRSKPQICSKS